MIMIINRDIPSPYAIQIEPTEGCSLACSFCGLQSIRNNGADAEKGIHGKNSPPYKFMTLELAKLIAAKIAVEGWNPRIEFALHGEPSMHPHIDKIIAEFRKAGPKWYIMMTSNGSGLLKDSVDRIDALFKAGLNTLALDDYKHSAGKDGVTWVTKIRKQLADDPIGIMAQTFEYPRDLEGNPHKRHNKKHLVFIHTIEENTKGTHQLSNQAGASFDKEYVGERCAKPFRELSIRWDGNVALCCDDWPGKYKVGNVNAASLTKIWYSQAFEAARRKLYAADRRFGPCNGCNVRTSRNGLLPDKLGKSAMLAPDAETMQVIAKAMGGKVFSIKPV